MNSHLLDPTGWMTREETREAEQRRIEAEYQDSLIQCPCGDYVEAGQITEIHGEGGLCPTCLALYQEQHPADSATESMLAVLPERVIEKLVSVVLMYSVAQGTDPDLAWFSQRLGGALKVKQDPTCLPY